MGTDVNFWGGLFLFSIANYDLLNGKLLKRQSDKIIRSKCDSAQFVVHGENRSVYVLLAFYPQGPGRVLRKSKKKKKKNCSFQKSDYSINFFLSGQLIMLFTKILLDTVFKHKCKGGRHGKAF